MKIFKRLTHLKQIYNKRTLVNLYKNIVLVTRLRIFCIVLFANNNIKVGIQMHAFLYDLLWFLIYVCNCAYNWDSRVERGGGNMTLLIFSKYFSISEIFKHIFDYKINMLTFLKKHTYNLNWLFCIKKLGLNMF